MTIDLYYQLVLVLSVVLNLVACLSLEVGQDYQDLMNFYFDRVLGRLRSIIVTEKMCIYISP